MLRTEAQTLREQPTLSTEPVQYLCRVWEASFGPVQEQGIFLLPPRRFASRVSLDQEHWSRRHLLQLTMMIQEIFRTRLRKMVSRGSRILVLLHLCLVLWARSP